MTGQNFFGLRVVVSPDRPRMTLSENCPVTPEYRIDTDAWLLGFFGTSNVLQDGQVIELRQEGVIVMNPRTYAQVQSAISESERRHVR